MRRNGGTSLQGLVLQNEGKGCSVFHRFERKLQIFLRVFAQMGAFLGCKRTLDTGGGADGKGTVRDDGARRDESARSHQTFTADSSVVQHDSAHSDERTVADGSAIFSYTGPSLRQ